MRSVNETDIVYLRKLEEVIEGIVSGRDKKTLPEIDSIIDKIIESSYCTTTPGNADKIKESVYEIRIILINIYRNAINITQEVLQGMCAEYNFIEQKFIERRI